MGRAADKRMEASRLIARCLVWEGSVGWTPECLAYSGGVLERYRRAGFHHLSLTIAAEWNGIEATMRHLARVRRFFAERPTEYTLAKCVDDITTARAEGRLAISFNFQGGGPFGGEPATAAIYAALGVRLAILSYNGRNAFGDGCQEPGNAGLSRQGCAMVGALNAAGIVIDLSHVGDRTARETIAASRHPVVFSHSNPAALHAHVRNIADDLIRACAARGGIIGLNSLGFMLDAENRSKAAKFVAHVRHVADLVGRGHVALGMDWNFYDPFMQQMFRDNPGMAALGYPPPPWDSLPPDRLPRIVERLVDAGWSDADVAGLLGQNMMRIARQVWPGA